MLKFVSYYILMQHNVDLHGSNFKPRKSLWYIITFEKKLWYIFVNLTWFELWPSRSLPMHLSTQESSLSLSQQNFHLHSK